MWYCTTDRLISSLLDDLFNKFFFYIVIINFCKHKCLNDSTKNPPYWMNNFPRGMKLFFTIQVNILNSLYNNSWNNSWNAFTYFIYSTRYSCNGKQRTIYLEWNVWAFTYLTHLTFTLPTKTFFHHFPFFYIFYILQYTFIPLSFSSPPLSLLRTTTSYLRF